MTYQSPLANHYQPKTVQSLNSVEVPWEFSSVNEEYHALREKVALLDYSYAGRIEVAGEKAMEFLQTLVTRELEFLMPERCLSCLLLTGEGRPVDVVTIYNREDRFLVETSPAGRDKVLDLLRSEAPAGLTVTDLSHSYGVLGLEGPYAWRTLGSIVDFEVSVLPFQGFLDAQWEGEQILVSRNGFTAEYGYQIYAAPEVIVKLWFALQEEATPVGYGALEIAMLEVRQPNLFREMGDDGTVIRCGLNWLVEIQKEEFSGREALLEQKEAGLDYLTVGLATAKDVQLAAGCAVAVADMEIGHLVYNVYSPGLDQMVGLCRLRHEWAASGLDLQVQDVQGIWQPARTLSSPYVIPKSWNVAIV
ncbi:MAG: aminomethyltransferase family protein [Bacillota bacterium]